MNFHTRTLDGATIKDGTCPSCGISSTERHFYNVENKTLLFECSECLKELCFECFYSLSCLPNTSKSEEELKENANLWDEIEKIK